MHASQQKSHTQLLGDNGYTETHVAALPFQEPDRPPHGKPLERHVVVQRLQMPQRRRRRLRLLRRQCDELRQLAPVQELARMKEAKENHGWVRAYGSDKFFL